ncbi:acyl-CoA:lysophosphatidylglycerol acyltransferase 1-like isoform X3 [Macrosteles quadrilineatus]|uniref:acyl-CoA:lysophosphatidylglycerol acyltransferase 1-like isoform X3 n=1 Tax=Macrosteles quadrilineatus TaxID=74068 RepID=UPI0023E15467|nr:acyl-CoA:lysophosphatidylglycerol acyltransferase 1-like isoform X3 [Macrosteles quadrilineatus]
MTTMSSSTSEEEILLLDPEDLRVLSRSRRLPTLAARLRLVGYSILLACKVIFRTVFVLLNNIYCIPTYAVWMLVLLPLKRYNPELYWKIEGTFFHWLLAMVSMWSWSAGYDIVEVGDDIRQCTEERTLVIANHQSTADVPMLMATFNPRPQVLPNIMWIMDRVFKFTNFGFVSVIHEDFFILSGRRHRDVAVLQLKKHIRDSYIPRDRKLMVLFPEGGFLRKRREISQRYALKNNLPVLNHVSLPRLGAMQGIIDVCGCKSDKVSPNNNTEVKGDYQLRWVLDITIAYPEGKPLDLPTIITGWRKPCQTFMFYRLFPGSQIPTETEAMTEWLFSRWQEKEQILSTFYSTGEIPVSQYCASPAPPQTVLQDPLRFFLLHVFFLTSSYVHFRLFTFLLATIW